MKNVLRICSVLALFAFLFSSCAGNLSVEKRHYRNGFYVHNSGKNLPVSTEKTPEKEASVSETKTLPQEPVAASQTVPAKTGNEAASTAATEKQTAFRAEKPVTQNAPTTEKPAVKKPLEKVKTALHKKPSPPASSDDEILLLILAILLPPLAIYLKQGLTTYFWLDLLCWIIGGGLVFSPFFYGGGLLLFAIVFAILIVFDVI